MTWWVMVDKNAIAANDADGGQRPAIVLTDPNGVQTRHRTLTGPGWHLACQSDTPRADRPHIWLELEHFDPRGRTHTT